MPFHQLHIDLTSTTLLLSRIVSRCISPNIPYPSWHWPASQGLETRGYVISYRSLQVGTRGILTIKTCLCDSMETRGYDISYRSLQVGTRGILIIRITCLCDPMETRGYDISYRSLQVGTRVKLTIKITCLCDYGNTAL